MSVFMAKFTHDPAYAPFLGAAVGEDGAGTNVSVLSMLARLNIDPWTEATHLAHMQNIPARQRLDGLLTRFSDVPSLLSDHGRVAARLLALLPQHSGAARLVQNPAAPSSSPSSSPSFSLPPAGAPIYWIIGAILVIGWIAALAHGG